jgi:hypothetical protein
MRFSLVTPAQNANLRAKSKPPKRDVSKVSLLNIIAQRRWARRGILFVSRLFIAPEHTFHLSADS